MSEQKFGESTLSGQVLRAIRTLREMCSDRGYAEDSNELLRLTDDACVSAVMSRMNLQVHATPSCLLVLYMAQRHNGSSIRSDLKKRVSQGVHRHLILVFREMPQNASVVVTKIKEDMPGLERVEMFHFGELQFNVTRHALVPKHERVSSPAEIAQVLKAFSVKKNQLPLIYTKADPVCRYLGIESGNLVKVTRTSPTGGQHVVYRYCV